MYAPKNSIAVIGMAGRFPGSESIDVLWENLVLGKDCVCDFDREALRRAGVPEDVIEHPDFVPSFGVLPDTDCFDSEFFGYSPREAALIDPQQRLFLECAWHALESAGRNPRENPERVGVFAGCSSNKYLLFNLLRNPAAYAPELLYGEDLIPAFSGADHLTSRVAYKLGLNGPSITVSAACAGSLVAVVLACNSLRDLECDVAIAGGVSISGRGPRGYIAKKGGMVSRGGRCRSYDAAADGSVFGDGVACVVLKRVDDVRRAGDQVHGYIRGWATSNDGGRKVGFSAPSVQGQADAIRAAMSMATVSAPEVGYVEGHGSGTRIGDPIEFAALQSAFEASGATAGGACGLGSIKSNIGHLDAASGIAGLIKAILCVREGVIPPTLHFSHPNPDIRLNESRFFVNSTGQAFPTSGDKSRIAGVSSFGLGGFNAHVVVESANQEARATLDTGEAPVLVPVGAGSPAAMSRQLGNYRRWAVTAGARRELDFAVTAAVRNDKTAYRAIAVGSTLAEISGQLETVEEEKAWIRAPETSFRVVFLYSGVGQQYRGMSADFHRRYAAFRQAFDTCAIQALKLGADIGWAIAEPDVAAPRIAKSAEMMRKETSSTGSCHAALFATGYAMTTLLQHLGVYPDLVLGHSLGELIACGATGVLSVEDALRLIVGRARLSDMAGPGAMIALPIPAEVAEAYCRDGVRVAAINTPSHTVLSGPEESVRRALVQLREDGIVAAALPTSSAFHSPMLSSVAEELSAMVAQCSFRSSSVPLYSLSHCRVVGEEELSKPIYWVNHLCSPVHWSQVLEKLMRETKSLFIEVGAGASLCEFGEEIARTRAVHDATFLPTIASGYLRGSVRGQFLGSIGRLWQEGKAIAWSRLHEPETGVVTSVPLYPFERTICWIDSPHPGPAQFHPDASRREQDPCAGKSYSVMPASTEWLGLARTPPEVRLCMPESSRGESGNFSAPLQRKLQEIWGAHFGRDVAANDDFLRIGGNSLMALQLTSAIWRALGLDIPVRKILEHRTIARLCRALDLDSSIRAPAHGALASRLVNVPEDMKEQAIIQWVIQVIQGADTDLDVPDPDLRLNSRQLREAVPDLIRAFRREFQAPFYPGEFYERATVRGIAGLALMALDNRRDAPGHVMRRRDRPGLARIGRAALVLSSVRSGSTLLRVMLAGHSRLFCPPELHLLEYATMRERAEKEHSPDRDQGLERAFGELLGDAQRGARKVEILNRENVATADVLRELIALAAPRLFVDKSPGNSNRVETLCRAEYLFDRPYYVFIVRHPYAVIDSVARNRFVEMLGFGDLNPHVLGELLWERSNTNILEHLSSIEDERKIAIRYEDLVQSPEEVMRAVTDRLGVDYEVGVLTPYEGGRMRDGLGDPNLSQHSEIRPELADAWKHAGLTSSLGVPTRMLARQFGYELALRDSGSDARSKPLSVFHPVTSLPTGVFRTAGCSAMQCELVALSDASQVSDGAPIILCCHALDGTVDLYRVFADELAEDAMTYGLMQMAHSERPEIEDLSELCADYLPVVRKLLRSGPVCLCGWSFGGAVAYELARRLSAAGESPPALILIDTQAPQNSAPAESDLVSAAVRYARALAASAGVDIPCHFATLPEISETDLCAHVGRRLIQEGLLDGSLLSGEFSRRVRCFEENSRLIRDYKARPLEAPATLIKATESRSGSDLEGQMSATQDGDGAYGWTELILGTLSVERVHASHYTLMKYPNVATVATLVKQVLRKEKMEANRMYTGGALESRPEGIMSALERINE